MDNIQLSICREAGNQEIVGGVPTDLNYLDQFRAPE